MEQMLRQILAKLENLEEDIKQIKPMVKENNKTIQELAPKVEESHQWIRALVENKEGQKAEMENLKYKIAAVEGVLQGFDKSLDLLKKAQ